MHQNQNTKIIDYYDATTSNYETVWCSAKSLALHFGYYDRTTRGHADSLLKINAVLSDMAGITRDDYVLDAGCGIGGSAIWLAKHIGCHVVGINIAASQLQKATIYAIDHGVNKMVSFEKQDYTSTSFTDNTFSVVWAQESFSHTDCKQAFINESFRILNEKGRLIIADNVLRENPPLTAHEQYTLDHWMHGWAMHGLLSLSQYQTMLKQAGFKRIEVHDITQNTIPSLRRLNVLAIIPGRIYSFMSKFKLDRWMKERDKLLSQHVRSAYYQYRALKSGVWKYMVVVAYKN